MLRAPFAARSAQRLAIPAEMFDDLERSGDVALSPELRERLARRVDRLVVRESLLQQAQPWGDVREQLNDLRESAVRFRTAIERLGEDAETAIARALRETDPMREPLTGVERVLRGIDLVKVPPGSREPPIIRSLVRILGPIFAMAGGRVSRRDDSPFVRFSQAVHGILPNELQHRQREDSVAAVPAAICNAIEWLNKREPEWLNHP